MKIKRWLSVFLCALLCVGVTPAIVSAEDTIDTWDGTADTSWYNSESTEFYLTTAEQLAGLAKLVNDDTTFAGKTVYLENDLDLSGHEWISIGYGANTLPGAFQGTFDGGSHTIYNLTSQEGSTSENDNNNTYRNGLFGCINNATIQNLGIENADIVIPMEDTSTYGKGILVDWMTNSTIKNCYTTGSITGGTAIEKYIGGIAGFLNGNNTISGCYSSAEITGNYDGSGYLEGAGLGPMDFWDSLGGIVGASYSGNATISDCWFDGKIVVNSIQAPVGGIIGFANNVTIQNCMVATTEIGSDSYYNTCWIGYTADSIDALNCYWPDDDKYVASLSNYNNSTSAGSAVQDFKDASLLEGLQENAGSDITWVEGIYHPTFDWDVNNISANYEAVNEAIKNAESLNPEDYSNFSAVEAAIDAVVWTKNVTEQAEVDAMAEAIENAIAGLQIKESTPAEDTTSGDAGTTQQDNPQTGDSKDMILWSALMVIAGASLIGAVLYGQKKKYNS